MIRLFAALTFVLFWLLGNLNFLGSLLLTGILGEFVPKPNTPDATQALVLLMLAGSFLIPALLALLIIWLPPVRRLRRSSRLSHRVLELGIAMSFLRLLTLPFLDLSHWWVANPWLAHAVHWIAKGAGPTLLAGLVLAYAVGKRSAQGAVQAEKLV
jgi:hypothetical protein